MSREHKYRVWDKQRQRMIVVTHLHFGDDGSGRTIILQEKTPEGYIRFLVMGENAELMEYTGLHDRAGNEIYEGDIIGSIDDPNYTGPVRFGKVEFDIDGGAYEVSMNCFYVETGLESVRTFVTECMNRGQEEVIGNIYEHPELMRKP